MQPPPPALRLTLPMHSIVRDGRELACLTQHQLADAAGVHRQVIARLEGGDQGVTLRHIAAVLSALDKAGIVLREDGRPDLRDAPGWERVAARR
jgi:predicted transcriptional regulator